MRYNIQAQIEIDFMGEDGNIQTKHQTVEGTIEANDRIAAAAQVKTVIDQRYPVCWAKRITSFTATPAS